MYEKFMGRHEVRAEDDGSTDFADEHQKFIEVPFLDGTQAPPQPSTKRYSLHSTGMHLNPSDDVGVLEESLSKRRWRLKP